MHNKFRNIIAAIILAAALPSSAPAAVDEPKHNYAKLDVLISNQALNGSPSFDLETSFSGFAQGYGVLVVYVKHTNSAATDVQMSCTVSPDNGTTDYVLQHCAVSAGDCTSSDANWTKAVTGDKNFAWRVDLLGYRSIACTFTGTSAGASDFVTVTGALVTQ